MQQENFMQALLHKRQMNCLLERIPVHVIVTSSYIEIQPCPPLLLVVNPTRSMSS
ncbi:hypothetical protein [Scytonema sp. PCC 10023]|uniref:hypothetical protein n=1 Tax=Scytonema sp. PCC 10023 TaxID=1680591 RepID=UPI0039C66B50